MNMLIKWSPEQIAKIKDLYDKGSSISAIAKEFTVSRSTIAGVMNRNRDLFPKSTSYVAKTPRNWTKEELEEMLNLYKTGTLLEHIAKRFGVVRQTISKVIANHPEMFPPRETPRSYYARVTPRANEFKQTSEQTSKDTMETLFDRPLDNDVVNPKVSSSRKSRWEPPKMKTPPSFPAAIKHEDLPDFYRRKIPKTKIPGYGVELVFLDKNACRNPIVEDNDTVGRYRFCGKPRTEDTPYCSSCSKILLRPKVA